MCSLYISYNRYHGVFRKVLFRKVLFVAVLFWSRLVHADLAMHATLAALCTGRDSCMLTSRCMLPWYHIRIWVAGWYQVHTCWYQVRTYVVHKTYPTLKPRLLEHTRTRAHAHTRKLFFWDVAIRNSLRSNKFSILGIALEFHSNKTRSNLLRLNIRS